jgi:hypothetical protein
MEHALFAFCFAKIKATTADISRSTLAEKAKNVSL